MRAVLASHPGGPEVLALAEVADPVPGPNEVLVDVAATAVNRADLLQRSGNYEPPPGASAILGLECSGVIAAVGDAVTGWSVGEQVCALLTGGGYAERVTVPTVQLMRIPAGVDLVTAAALPEVACTVYSMVLDHGGLQPGETFLVHGGSSGIGTMATQLAKATGARVFATAGSPAKVQACRDYGTDVAINYREQDFAQVVAAETAGRGVDVILDTIGAKYLTQNVAALAVGGRISMIGMMGGVAGEINLGRLMSKLGTIYAATLRGRPIEEKAAIVAATEAHVWPLVESGAVRPVVYERFALGDAAKAHQLVQDSTHIGKVLLIR